MSGTRGSSGLGSHRRLHIDSKTVCVCVCVCLGEKKIERKISKNGEVCPHNLF